MRTLARNGIRSDESGGLENFVLTWHQKTYSNVANCLLALQELGTTWPSDTIKNLLPFLWQTFGKLKSIQWKPTYSTDYNAHLGSNTSRRKQEFDVFWNTLQEQDVLF